MSYDASESSYCHFAMTRDYCCSRTSIGLSNELDVGFLARYFEARRLQFTLYLPIRQRSKRHQPPPRWSPPAELKSGRVVRSATLSPHASFLRLPVRCRLDWLRPDPDIVQRTNCLLSIHSQKNFASFSLLLYPRRDTTCASSSNPTSAKVLFVLYSLDYVCAGGGACW